jgi:peptidylprolyl isomerase domain and WD repeat-containing protein 1
MSDSESGPAVSLKRTRDDANGEKTSISAGTGSNGNGGRLASDDVPEMPPADMDDSDDEEIGPMPDVPSVEMSKGRKKKRAVLPHERVFLDNMPDTDRYTKSFMHRADLNFVTMTK